MQVMFPRMTTSVFSPYQDIAQVRRSPPQALYFDSISCNAYTSPSGWLAASPGAYPCLHRLGPRHVPLELTNCAFLPNSSPPPFAFFFFLSFIILSRFCHLLGYHAFSHSSSCAGQLLRWPGSPGIHAASPHRTSQNRTGDFRNSPVTQSIRSQTSLVRTSHQSAIASHWPCLMCLA